MRKVIRSLIVEQLEKERLIKEADVASAMDVFQTLWNLASAGFISYQFAKAVYNSYKSGKKTEQEIEDMVQGLTIEYLKNGEETDLDYLDKTEPYKMSKFDRAVDAELDYDDTIEAPRSVEDTLIFDRDDINDEETLDLFYDFDEETESDENLANTEVRTIRYDDTKKLWSQL